MKNLIWFKTELRLGTNPLLQYAHNKGLNSLFPIFTVNLKAIVESEFYSVDRYHFLAQALEDLAESLEKVGSKLILIEGDYNTISKKIAKLEKFNLIAGKRYSKRALARDIKLKELFQSNYHLVKSNVIYDNEDGLLTGKKEPIKVFTAFRNAWIKKLLAENFSPINFDYDPRSLFASKAEILAFEKELLAAGITLLNVKDLVEKFKSEKNYFKGGEVEAEKLWQEFYSEKLPLYKDKRDFLFTAGTSRLSPHLKWGTISPHQIIQDITKVLNGSISDFKHIPANHLGYATYLSEIVWREFYFYMHALHPEVETESFQTKFDQIQWENSKEKFEKWCQGETGYPIVDACMKQLNETGWMHNRGRMIVASFLTKDLHIDWRWGEKYFHQKLVDYELASNNGGWQWTAGTGTDASPYFRIFNPTEQAKKFDPDCVFIKKYLPKLNHLSPEQTFKLTESPVPGLDYPLPMVDHKVARKKTLDLYKV